MFHYNHVCAQAHPFIVGSWLRVFSHTHIHIFQLILLNCNCFFSLYLVKIIAIVFAIYWHKAKLKRATEKEKQQISYHNVIFLLNMQFVCFFLFVPFCRALFVPSSYNNIAMGREKKALASVNQRMFIHNENKVLQSLQLCCVCVFFFCFGFANVLLALSLRWCTCNFRLPPAFFLCWYVRVWQKWNSHSPIPFVPTFYWCWSILLSLLFCV